MRYFDVADISDANKILFYEFKSVAKVPPAHFAEQFLKDLSNKDVTSLDQIKWIFDVKKNPAGTGTKSFEKAIEDAIDNLKLDKDLAKKFLKDVDNPSVKDLKKYLKKNSGKLFLII